MFISAIKKLALLLCVTALTSEIAIAQQFPNKPITFIVPFAAGTATDQLARKLGQIISDEIHQPVIVDPRAGANGIIGAQVAAKAKNDGYTVFITTNTTQAANQFFYSKLPYDPVKDFEPITLLGTGGLMLVVNNNATYHNVVEFVKYVKDRPGKLSFGSSTSSSRMAAELFNQMAGTSMVNVPYRSNPAAITDVIGGQIDVIFTDMATGLSQSSSGTVKALAVSTAQRNPRAPQVPTIGEEAALRGYELHYWFAAYAPAGTPKPIIDRLNQILVKAVASPAANDFYMTTGHMPEVSTPDELRKFQETEAVKWHRIITAAGIKPE